MGELHVHCVTTRFVESRCGTPGHRDLQAVCSCGWTHAVSHGPLDGADGAILGHRLAMLEAAAGLRFKRKHDPEPPSAPRPARDITDVLRSAEALEAFGVQVPRKDKT